MKFKVNKRKGLSITEIRKLKVGDEVKVEYRRPTGEKFIKGKVLEVDVSNRKIHVVGYNNNLYSYKVIGYGNYHDGSPIGDVSKARLDKDKKDDLEELYLKLKEIKEKERELLNLNKKFERLRGTLSKNSLVNSYNTLEETLQKGEYIW